MGGLLNRARWLDETLQERLGRPYNIILTIGLVSELIRSIHEFSDHALKATSVAGGLFAVVVELALLLHQLGSLSHRFHRSHARATADGAKPLSDPIEGGGEGRGGP